MRYYSSNIILLVNSNTAYLVMLKEKSRIARYFQLNYYPKRGPHLKLNGAILVECKALKHVVLSVVEAEIVGIFYNA